MDALQQQPHRFMTAPPPPPSSMSDPQQNHQPPRLPPPPPQATWYPNQFQYHASPAPPQPHPNNQSMWPNNNHSDHQQQQPISSSYPTPHQHTTHAPPPPYPTHPPPQPQSNFYPPSPHQPPTYSHSQPPQAYSQQNAYQTWGNPNWGHHQVWEHPDRIDPNNNEDWATKARAWAASKSSMESQHQPSQFTHISRPEEPNHSIQDQYQRTVDPHYANIQQPSLPATNHQQFSVPTGDPHRIPSNHLQESPSFNSGSSSYYASGLHVPYANRGGGYGADPNLVYPDQGNILTNSAGYQQEVPSSYSSVPGKGEVGGQDVQLHTTPSLPISSGQETQHHVHPTLSASGRSISEEQSYFAYGVGSAGSVSDPSDRPLEFAPGFNRNHESHDQHLQSSYIHPDPAGSVGYADHVTSVTSMSALTHPVIPGMGYPPSGVQFDPSFVPPAPMFGQIPGPNFRSNVPTGGAAFGLGGGSVLHPTAAFPGEPNGIPSVSDRPKKASVPNWLREEIIKKKTVIASSSLQRLEEDTDNSTEDDFTEKSFVNRGPENSKSIDSSRSSDNEDNDEDGIEAARTVAINQEIKRVVTEVLLKVTDELFDEIATKVLKEDDLAVEVENNNFPPNQKLSPSPPSVPALKASAKVLVPVKTEETKSDYASGKPPSVSAGDVLGLGSYDSDDDDYDETESSSKSIKSRMAAAPPPASTKLSEAIHEVVENGVSQAETKGPSGTNRGNDQDKTDLAEPFSNPTAMELDKNLNHEKDSVSIFNKGGAVTQEGTVSADGENTGEATDDLKSKDIVRGKNSMKADLPRGIVGSKSPTNVSEASQVRSKSDKNQEQENKRSYSSKNSVKESGSGSLKVDSKHSGSGEPRRDERHTRKEKTDERNGLKERVKDRGSKSGDKARESDSRRSSHSKDEKTENEKIKKDNAKDDSSRKRARERDEKEDRLRHHGGRDSSSHKRRHSPSVDGRVRNSKDNSIGSHATESSDEASEDSRQRKKHSRRRSLSPSPTRSRRRQVLRSPHSKHSHRRQSPYSSLESRRGRRSRSNTPVRRRR